MSTDPAPNPLESLRILARPLLTEAGRPIPGLPPELNGLVEILTASEETRWPPEFFEQTLQDFNRFLSFDAEVFGALQRTILTRSLNQNLIALGRIGFGIRSEIWLCVDWMNLSADLQEQTERDIKPFNVRKDIQQLLQELAGKPPEASPSVQPLIQLSAASSSSYSFSSEVMPTRRQGRPSHMGTSFRTRRYFLEVYQDLMTVQVLREVFQLVGFCFLTEDHDVPALLTDYVRLGSSRSDQEITLPLDLKRFFEVLYQYREQTQTVYAASLQESLIKTVQDFIQSLDLPKIRADTQEVMHKCLALLMPGWSSALNDSLRDIQQRWTLFEVAIREKVFSVVRRIFHDLELSGRTEPRLTDERGLSAQFREKILEKIFPKEGCVIIENDVNIFKNRKLVDFMQHVDPMFAYAHDVYLRVAKVLFHLSSIFGKSEEDIKKDQSSGLVAVFTTIVSRFNLDEVMLENVNARCRFWANAVVAFVEGQLLGTPQQPGYLCASYRPLDDRYFWVIFEEQRLAIDLGQESPVAKPQPVQPSELGRYFMSQSPGAKLQQVERLRLQVVYFSHLKTELMALKKRYEEIHHEFSRTRLSVQAQRDFETLLPTALKFAKNPAILFQDCPEGSTSTAISGPSKAR